jgi:hypothetical protein
MELRRAFLAEECMQASLKEVSSAGLCRKRGLILGVS